MRILPVRLRLAILALGAVQLAAAPLAAVADGLMRSPASNPEAHVEGFGSTHDTRAHPHECAACTALRPCYVAPSAPAPFVAPATSPATPDCGTTVASSGAGQASRARSPPARIG
ncbi:MAG TPA: hypothetical protein VFZ56_08925 [Gemmatimonadaceae bacterium]